MRGVIVRGSAVVIGALALIAQALTASPSTAVDDVFTSLWDTRYTSYLSSSRTQVRLPLTAGLHNFVVDWGDGATGTVTTHDDPDATHEYSVAGRYTVTIQGTIRGFSFNGSGDRLKLIEVRNWGPLALGNSGGYFAGAENLTITAEDRPSLDGTTDCSNTFGGAKKLTSGVSAWDVSSCRTMLGMFAEAALFNDDLSRWDTSKVESFYAMFSNASRFNGSIGGWNTSNATNMAAMFGRAESFDQPIGNWDTSKVTNMTRMFDAAKAFSHEIGDWDTSQVQQMAYLLNGASAYNHDLGRWDVQNVGSTPTILGAMEGMLTGTAMTPDNYGATLIGWASQPDLQMNVALDSDSSYSANSVGARSRLIEEYGWVIRDRGLQGSGGSPNPSDPPPPTSGSPRLAVAASKADALTGETVVFSAALHGSGVSGARFEWDGGDGQFSPGAASRSVSWDEPGNRQITVRAVLADGQVLTSFTSIRIYRAPVRQLGISINGGEPYTNSRKVTVDLGWPAFATGVLMSNDGGFAQARTVDLAGEVDWVLDDALAGRYTKVVYARFAGPFLDSSQTFSDDIVFDNVAPQLLSATASARGATQSASAISLAQSKPGRAWSVKTSARDARSGVRTLQASPAKGNRGAVSVRYRKSVKVVLKKSTPRLFVRVRDGAGNWSSWRLAK